MPGKKENNDKNYQSRNSWLENKKKNRLKQVWVQTGVGKWTPLHHNLD